MRSNTSLNIVPKKMEATPYGLDVFGGVAKNCMRVARAPLSASPELYSFARSLSFTTSNHNTP